MSRFPFTLSLALLLAACVASPAASESGSSPLPQWAGTQSGIHSPSSRVIRDAAEWDALWQQLNRDRPQPLGSPREMAVAIFLGERRTAGYRAEVVGTREADGKLVIEYREHTPDPDRMVAQVLTSPWVVVLVPASDQPVVPRKSAADR